MENNVVKTNKNMILIIVFLIVLLLIIVGLVCYQQLFKKDNNTSKVDGKDSTEVVDNNVDKAINPELDNAILFARKNEVELVAITSDGREIPIYDFSHGFYVDDNKVIIDSSNNSVFYFDYDQDEKNIYLFLYGSKSEKYLALIDLKNGNGNYKPEIITKVDWSDNEMTALGNGYGYAYIAKIDNVIYFSNSIIFKYDMQSKKIEKTDIKNESRGMWLSKNKSYLIYNDDSNIYTLDTKTNKSEKIISHASPAYIYNGKLVYQSEGMMDDNGEKDEDDLGYYLYDFNTGERKRITNYFGRAKLDKEFVIPFGDTIYSFDGLKLYGYNGNEIEEKYSFTCNDFTGIIDNCTTEILSSINNMVKTSDESVLMEFGDDFDGGELYYVEFNINTKMVTPVESRNTDQYLNEYYLK